MKKRRKGAEKRLEKREAVLANDRLFCVGHAVATEERSTRSIEPEQKTISTFALFFRPRYMRCSPVHTFEAKISAEQ